MRDCENCIYSGKDGCVKWECEFVSKEEARRIVAEKKELPTANLVKGDCISRESVIQLTREMISAEEYGLMDLLDEVKKLPTIPQIDLELVDKKRLLNKMWRDFWAMEDKKTEEQGADYVGLPRLYEQNGFDCALRTVVDFPTIPQTDYSEVLEITVNALKSVVDRLKEMPPEDLMKMYMNVKQTDTVLAEIKAEIEKLPRIKVGNSNSPTVKYCIDERLIYEVLEKHISRKE